MIVDEKLVLHMVDDEQLVLHKFVAVEEVNRNVVKEMLKTVDYTMVGCIVDCCKMELKYLALCISFANLTSVTNLLHSG
ncbi:hypothetical protein Tco_1160412 [Tanacetum coccineum]